MSGDPWLNAKGLALSDRYAETMREVMLPRIDSCRTVLVVPGDGGRPLFVSRFDAKARRGTVMLLHGFTENVIKHTELIHSLLESDMSVVAYDQRGHGRSWRHPALADADPHRRVRGVCVGHVGRLCTDAAGHAHAPSRVLPLHGRRVDGALSGEP